MSEKPIEKCCGTCSKAVPLVSEFTRELFVDCSESLARWEELAIGIKASGFPDAIVTRLHVQPMHVNWGKQCPCHTPKPETQP